MIKIGLEIHVQLNTKSKIFCNCSTEISNRPNTHVCPTCLGLPGSKPVLNEEVLKQAIKVSLALKCKINREMFFSRKTYFYPDLCKNFQITQYEMPLAVKGELNKIRIRRIHIEEDPGKSVHLGQSTLIDYNRSGIPLIEIVTEPDFKSPGEARDFLNKLVVILEYLNVYFRTSEATLRTDANISSGGERVEIKNINGVRDVERALQYEVERQKVERAIQETRGWDAEKGVTYSQRVKETEEDYGYITEPDLTRFEIKDVGKIRDEIPELAEERARRFVKQYKINEDDANVLTQEIILSELYEKVAKRIDPVLAAKWLRRDLLKMLHINKKNLNEIRMDEVNIIELLEMVGRKEITDPTAKELLNKLIKKPFDIRKYVEKENLKAFSDRKDLERFCREAIKENARAVEDYKSGRKEAIHFLVGKVMGKTKGKATPQELIKIMEKLL